MFTCVTSKSFWKLNFAGLSSVITNLLSASEAKLQTATCMKKRKTFYIHISYKQLLMIIRDVIKIFSRKLSFPRKEKLSSECKPVNFPIAFALDETSWQHWWLLCENSLESSYWLCHCMEFRIWWGHLAKTVVITQKKLDCMLCTK